ncbi:MAG: hypothetical protein J0H08_13525 [Rhizobiales bacterium]|nr:hypothetical protein [Hyphomicrobiales bacterium]
MRMPSLLAFVTLAAVPATAQQSTFYVDRGDWTIYNTSAACRAVNRPMADFNAAPFNALQIVVRPGGRIGVEVFFWPGAIDPAAANELALGFGGPTPMILSATTPMGDYVLASKDDPELWSRLGKAKTLTARVKADPNVALAFSLDQIGWVLATLQSCTRILPTE